jgi:hypothetical protein
MAIGDRRSAVRSLLLGLGSGFLISACDVTPSEQFTPQLVVHGQLQVGSTDNLRVLVNRTYKIGDPYDWSFGNPKVTVSHGYYLTRPQNRIYDVNYTFEPTLSVRPGDTFDIVVAEPAFDTVRGRTVVPDTFRFLYPRDGDTVTLYDSLGWTRSRTAAGYTFSVLDYQNGDTSSYDVVIGNDSSGSEYDSTRVQIPSLFFYYRQKPGWHTLTVYALDSNYYDWIRLVGFGGGGGTPPETTRLVGGLGVFGSAAVETLRLYLREDTASRQEPRPARRGPGVRLN